MDARYELLLKERDEIREERDMYFSVLGTRGEALRNMEDENTALKEENARLKTAVARGGGSSEASKNLKTVNTTLMRQNGELKKENGELKKENKDLVKKHSEMAGRVNAFKSTEKKLAVLEVYAKSRDGDFQACKHDFHRMRKMKESLEKELDEAKKAGADTTLAKTLKNLEDKVFSQVGCSSVFCLFILLLTATAGQRHQGAPGQRQEVRQEHRLLDRARRQVPHGALQHARRVPVRHQRRAAEDQDPRRGRGPRLRRRGAHERRRAQALACLGD